MAQKIVAACGDSVRGKTHPRAGLHLQAQHRRHAEAPSLSILPVLAAEGADVWAYDPAAMAEARKLLPEVKTAADPYTCIEGADAVVILTNGTSFALDLDRVKTILRKPSWSTCAYRPDDMAARGFTYVSIGHPRTHEPA